ncbi:MAG TPA: NAD+ synthase [Gammaproteobacteria bacterium]|jgi:NAD+ synthase (glutamine-hydrolysing)|nr:NAD+ synthase [Gammaproteobacteria bacterium]HIL62713.1 NAD+ synthase [Porticoccaceae bacterium]
MAGQLRVVMAQLNLMVGDIEGNTSLVLENAERAISEFAADLIVFPELTLTAYPPEDLLLRPSLKLRIDRAIDAILQADLPIHIVLGFPESIDGKLFNALTVLKGGSRLATYHKQCLPNYQVFDERRYFHAGAEPCVLNIAGIRLGFTICEDMWEQIPFKQARDAGADLMININASPYHIHKLEQRQALLKQRSMEGGFPIIYVNLVGGQDELVFDGASMAMSASGECHYLAPNFEAGLHLVIVDIQNLDSQEFAVKRCEIPRQSLAAEQSPIASVYHALVLGVRDYVNKNKFVGTVLGLSGGIDSALTLAIAVDALGKDRVQAVMMPFEYTSKLSLDAAADQAQRLDVEYQVIPIGRIYAAFIEALELEFSGLPVDVSEQNIQARCRGVILMAISNKKQLMVLTTGNKSECAVGYSTLYGDMAGGFDVLKDVSKTLVYQLATYRNAEYGSQGEEVIPQQVIDRSPSAELAPNQLDQDSLPPYEDLDRILELYIENDYSADAIVAEGYAEEVVKKVLRLVDLNEYKRRQSPVGVRLTARGFGRDRRYPITNAWPLGE